MLVCGEPAAAALVATIGSPFAMLPRGLSQALADPELHFDGIHRASRTISEQNGKIGPLAGVAGSGRRTPVDTPAIYFVRKKVLCAQHLPHHCAHNGNG